MPAVLFTLTISGTVSGLVHNLDLVPDHKPVAVTRFVLSTACPFLGRVPL